MPFFSGMAKPTWLLPGMPTRMPSLGITQHAYNRLQAGCYLAIDFDFKDHLNIAKERAENDP